ncbi:bifunctional riboflavin kinase/FAD synthetase [bacterium]|nr:bifunctional riboflavin kinase/FAD synthetase [bacterium]
MIIVRGLYNLKLDLSNVCLSMGNFDGLHLGHKKIIDSMMERASQIGGMGVLFTFSPHPRWILTPDAPMLLLTTLHEQVRILSKWRLGVLFLAKFDQCMATMDPERFVEDILVKRLMIKEIFVGEGFTFGHKKAGTIDLLERLGGNFGFKVNKIGLMKREGHVISSTLIRHKIRSGHIEQANQLLGYEYGLTGKVIKGSGRGWHLGYPTANLKIVSKVLPPKGVYLVKIEKQGRIWPGLANLGSKPTFEKDGAMGVEVYIMDVDEDLYDQKLTIYFQKWIREEIAFPSPKDLIKQIKTDIRKAQKWITNHPC